MIRKTKIICTIGPACNGVEIMREMMISGMNIARINLSHSENQDFVSVIEQIIKIREELDIPVAIMQDTRGPEVRTCTFIGDSVMLQTDSEIRLCHGSFLGDEKNIPITYDKLYKDVKVGTSILLDDGLIELTVTNIAREDIICEVNIGGIIKNHKGINVPGVSLQQPILSDKDMADIISGIELGVDFIAASFTRNQMDIRIIRDFLDTNGGQHIKIISKIENQQGLDAVDQIIANSDGVMVARGDLGVEVADENIPMIQKQIISKCNKARVPVITATQMLESMIYNPHPTRAELSDVANAVLDGTDVIMLSGETAIGKYPLRVVREMSKIAFATERSLDDSRLYNRPKSTGKVSITHAVSYSVCSTAQSIDANAIICPTYSGQTAKLISNLRPNVDIVAMTVTGRVQRQLQLYFGVVPLLVEEEQSIDLLFYKSITLAKSKGLLHKGDIVVVTAGVPLGQVKDTNLMRIMDVR